MGKFDKTVIAKLRKYGELLTRRSQADDRDTLLALGKTVLDDVYDGDIVALRDKHNKTMPSYRKMEKDTGVPVARLSRGVAAAFAHRNIDPTHRNVPTAGQLVLLGQEKSKLDAAAIRTVTDLLFARTASPGLDDIHEAIQKFHSGGKDWTDFAKDPDAAVAAEDPDALVADVLRREGWIHVLSDDLDVSAYDYLSDADKDAKILFAFSTLTPDEQGKLRARLARFQRLVDTGGEDNAAVGVPVQSSGTQPIAWASSEFLALLTADSRQISHAVLQLQPEQLAELDAGLNDLRKLLKQLLPAKKKITPDMCMLDPDHGPHTFERADVDGVEHCKCGRTRKAKSSIP